MDNLRLIKQFIIKNNGAAGKAGANIVVYPNCIAIPVYSSYKTFCGCFIFDYSRFSKN